MTTMPSSAIGAIREASRDGEKGFATAADDASRPDLKELFRDCSVQRANFGRELDRRLRMMGVEEDESGTVTGALHRGWIELRAAVSNGGDLALLEECLRGDESALASFQTAIEDPDVTGELHDLVVSQRQDIQATFNHISSIKADFNADR